MVHTQPVLIQVIRVAEEREEVEVIIKEELTKNPGPPGKYYPFKPPIKVCDCPAPGPILLCKRVIHHPGTHTRIDT